MSGRIRIVWLATTLAVMTPTIADAAREEIDVISMKNGDRITGEIISLEYGELSVKTKSLSTITIQWPDVAAVQSKQGFILEDLSGGRFYGTLSADSESNTMSIHQPDGTVHDVALLDITRLSPGEETVWSRMQGSFSVGFDYTKSSDITTISGAFDLSYRAPAFAWSLSADVNTTRDPAQGT
ncbi:MAG TPA: hypothetical protein VKB34_02645, partial [Povalibacter sp.]|nr:hypothetical protein [Povalibacter sp.]